MLQTILQSGWIIFQVAVAVMLLFPVFSYLIFLVKKTTLPVSSKLHQQNDYGIIVTAYQNSANLDHVIQSILKVKHERYIVYVVADNCPDYEDHFNDDRVVIIKPIKTLGNQLKSHFLAIQHFKRPHHLLTIIDSDNIVHPNYLAALDPFFNSGYEAVQGTRTAKNLDTHYACIDAVNELYYLFYDRKILFNIGSSCMLSGSGMAFTVSLYRECLEKLNNEGAGFDKVLQYQIMKRGYRIAFAEQAIVYDEKTAHSDQLVKQRARWNNTWFRYFKYGFELMGMGIQKGKMNPFIFGFILTRPPLFILLFLCGMIFIANLIISINTAICWLAFIGIFMAGFFLALLNSNTDKRIYQSLVHIPKFIFLQLMSLFKARKANEFSVATEHRFNKDIDPL
jgi:cellulose synthase/poly-beta-1,6-N-acetylglucosamine synthase-like glycosyltransferase